MRLPSLRAAALALLALSTPALAAAPQAAAPAPKAAKAAPARTVAGLKSVHSVEGISEFALPNGLRVLLFPDPTKPTATVSVTYFVGSRHEGYGETGMAHLLEHLLFKGTPRHRNIPQELTERGARPNGTTWWDRTNYFETFPASDANLRWALELEADRMVNSFVAKKDLDSEMTVVRNEFERGENDPSSVLLERVMSTAYLWHNYGNTTIGSRADLENVPIDRLQAFYRRYYQPDNAMLVIAGKFDEAAALRLVQQTFGRIPRPARPLSAIADYTREPTQDGERHVMLRRVGEVGVATAMWHVPEGAHPDFAAVDVLTELLGSRPAGRLHKALVETQKAASAGAFNFQLKHPGALVASAEVRQGKDAQDLDGALKVMLATVEGAAQKPFTQEEVDRAKTALLKQVELLLNSSERSAIALSESAALGDWRMLFLHRDRIESVTPADVTRVAATYLKPANRTSGVFIPTEKPDRAEQPAPVQVADMLEGYTGREAVAQGEAFDPSPANIEARVRRGALPSGVKFALLPKKTRGEMVSLQLNLRFGSEAALMGKAMAAETAGSMLMRGTKKHTRQQLKDAFDRLKARVSVGGGTTGASAFVETKRENLPEVLKLVVEVLREPAFDPKEFAELQQERLAGLEAQRTEPDALASVAYRRAVSPYPKGHPYYAMTLDERIQAVRDAKLEDARAFHQAFYGASVGEVAAVGDFDDKALEKQLAELLQGFKSPQPYARVVPRLQVPEAKTLALETPDKANAFFMAGTQLKLKDDHPDYAALSMGNFMLGGGFLNSRLATRIRQKEGLSYGVGSSLSASALDELGSFSSYAIYAPENVERLDKAWTEELQKATQQGFTQDELNRARQGLLEYRQTGRAQDGGLARTLADYLFFDRTLKFDAELDRRLAALTPKDVQQALARHVDPAKVLRVRAGDFAGAAKKAKAPLAAPEKN